MNLHRRDWLTLSICAAASPWGAAMAEDFPTRPIRIVVPFSAGALTDIIARMYADKLRAMVGQTVLVENRPGAGGVTASQAVLAAAADGHTMLFVSSAHASNPALRKQLPYQTEKDFSGLALLAASPSVVVVPAKSKAATLEDLIRIGKEKPGTLNFGSAGIGSATHLAGKYFEKTAGLQMEHVPYRGVQEAVTAVAAEQLDMAFPPVALAQPLIEAGRIRALAVTSPERVPVMSNTPTVAEKGYPGFDSSIWYALVMSSATPKSAMATLAEHMLKITAMPDIQEKMRAQGLVQKTLTLGEFDKFIASDMRRLAALVRESGIQPE